MANFTPDALQFHQLLEGDQVFGSALELLKKLIFLKQGNKQVK